MATIMAIHTSITRTNFYPNIWSKTIINPKTMAPPTPKISPTLSKPRPTMIGKVETIEIIDIFSIKLVQYPRPREVPEPIRLSKTRTLR